MAGKREERSGVKRYRDYARRLHIAVGGAAPRELIAPLGVKLGDSQTYNWIEGSNRYNMVKHSVKRVMDRREIPSNKRKPYYKFVNELWRLEIKNKEGEFVIKNRADLNYLKARFRRRNEEMRNEIMDDIIEEIMKSLKKFMLQCRK